MPLPLDCKLFQIKGWMCAMFCCIPPLNTMLLVAGIRSLLAEWWMNALSALLSSHSPWLSHHIHTLSQIIQAPLNPMLVFLSFSFCAISSYRSYFLSPNDSGHAGTLPWIPPTIFLSASQFLSSLQSDTLLRNTVALSYISCCILVLTRYLHLIEHNLGKVVFMVEDIALWSVDIEQLVF